MIMVSIIGVGMEICPNCGKKIDEFRYTDIVPFPHTDITYRCECGFWTHFTVRNDEVVSQSMKNKVEFDWGAILKHAGRELEQQRKKKAQGIDPKDYL
jgi:lysyl-tRNA synthetase class I